MPVTVMRQQEIVEVVEVGRHTTLVVPIVPVGQYQSYQALENWSFQPAGYQTYQALNRVVGVGLVLRRNVGSNQARVSPPARFYAHLRVQHTQPVPLSVTSTLLVTFVN